MGLNRDFRLGISRNR